MRVAVVGSISMDYVINTDQIPIEGETVIGKQFKTHFGGKGANQAIAVKRSGVETFMVGAVGDDGIGHEMLENLIANDISTDMVKVVPNEHSGVAFIQVKDGDNRIIVVEGANAHLSISDIERHRDRLNEMDMVVLQNELPIAVIEHVIGFCHEHTIPVLYNPAPVKEIKTELLPLVDYLTPNLTECQALFENQSLDDLLALYPNKLIVTLGEQGATYHDGERAIVVPAMRVDNVVDTTGAGDTFNGYLVRSLLEEKALKEAIELSTRASAVAIQKEGAQTGIPFYQDV